MMDPDACLSEIRALVSRSLADGLDTFETDRLVDLVDALDGWCARQGALPSPWEVGRCLVSHDGPVVS